MSTSKLSSENTLVVTWIQDISNQKSLFLFFPLLTFLFDMTTAILYELYCSEMIKWLGWLQ